MTLKMMHAITSPHHLKIIFLLRLYTKADVLKCIQIVVLSYNAKC